MKKLVALFLLGFVFTHSVRAASVNIDFEETVTSGVVSSLESQGFTFATVNPFFTLAIDDNPPSGADGNALRFVGITPLVRITRTEGEVFSLNSLDIHLDCGDPTYCLNDNWVVSAYDAADGLINQITIDPQGFVGWQSQVFGGTWSSITRLELQAETGSEGVTAYVDNVQLNVVPIPAAAWLFGSGLCLLGWMRGKTA